MYLLPDLLRHNAWANATVVESFRSKPEALDVVCYDGDPLLSRLQHMVGTERAFLDVLRGSPALPEPPSDLEGLIAYDRETGAGLLSAAMTSGEGGQEQPYFVPWWQASMPMHVLVSQVIGHSAQHRAELAWELARAEVNTGEIDYIGWVAGGQPEPGGALRFQDD